MAKYDKALNKMSFLDQVSMLVSSNYYQNSEVGTYYFPTLKMFSSNIPSSKIKLTNFADNKMLGETFNSELISHVFECVCKESRLSAKNVCLYVSDNPKQIESFSEDYYLNSIYLRSMVKGANKARVPVCYDITSFDSHDFNTMEAKILEANKIFKEVSPSVVIVDSKEEIEFVKNQFDYTGVFFGRSNSLAEIASLFINGAILVFSEISVDDIATYFTKLIERYNKAKEDLDNFNISQSEFNTLVVNEEILSKEDFLNICHRFLDFLNELSDNNDYASYNNEQSNVDAFDENEHNAIASEVAKESIVLLKNGNDVLPLMPNESVCIVGDYAKNKAYQDSIFNGLTTRSNIPLDYIETYEEFNVEGFAYGYIEDEQLNDESIRSTIDLVKKSNVVILYLYAKDGAIKLADNQLNLIDILANERKKIVAVLSTKNPIDLGFIDKVDALILDRRGGQGVSEAILDVISGKINPSGRLSVTWPKVIEDLEDNEHTDEPYYFLNDYETPLFPFGYGLSYSTFIYSNLEINEDGAIFTIKNNSKNGGTCIPQLYVNKKSTSHSLRHSCLKGYSKVYLRAYETVKVKIPFDEYTFAYYDVLLSSYGIEGGQYEIRVNDNSLDNRLFGTITLERVMLKDQGYKNELVESDNDVSKALGEFVNTKDRKEGIRSKIGIPFNAKLLISIFISVYFSAFLVYLGISVLNNNNLLPLAIVIFVIAMAIQVVEVIYIVSICKKKKVEIPYDPDSTLKRLVNEVGDFSSIYDIKYKEPISKVSIEQEMKEEEERTRKLEEEAKAKEEQTKVAKRRTYVNTLSSTNQDIDFTNSISFHEVCANFMSFLESKGISAEITSTRAFIASLFSSNIVILSCKNKDIFPDFLNLVNEYFANTYPFTNINENVKEVNDLYWDKEEKDDEDEFHVSNFINTVYNASQNKSINTVAILNNVDMVNVHYYFKDFIFFASKPTELHQITVNEELKINLPKNITYILVPSSDDYQQTMDLELASVSSSVEMIITSCDAKEEVEIKALSYEDTKRLVEDDRSINYLKEESWKKIDDLEEELSKLERFKITNKLVLDIEKFVGIYIDCGGDETEALITSYVSKIVPILKHTKTYKSEDGERTFSNMLTRIFKDEDISKITKALSKTTKL